MATSVGQSVLQEPALSQETRAAELKQLDKDAPAITTNPRRMSGTPVIGIERMPVTTLLDYLMDDYSISDFLAAFPGTEREKVVAALQVIRDAFDDGRLTELLAERVDY